MNRLSQHKTLHSRRWQADKRYAQRCTYNTVEQNRRLKDLLAPEHVLPPSDNTRTGTRIACECFIGQSQSDSCFCQADWLMSCVTGSYWLLVLLQKSWPFDATAPFCHFFSCRHLNIFWDCVSNYLQYCIHSNTMLFAQTEENMHWGLPHSHSTHAFLIT